MENQVKLTRKYSLPTAIAMVVGIVIGSGVFFKAEQILKTTEGNMTMGMLAWVVGGLMMIISAYTFAILATQFERVSGVVDYSDVLVSKHYGYFLGWFMTWIYYPAMTGVLAWVSARYFGVLFGWSLYGGDVLALAGFFLIVIYALNSLAPKISGKFQVSTTAIKLVPLLLMAVVGTIYGITKQVPKFGVGLVDGQIAVVRVSGGESVRFLIENFGYEGGGNFKIFLGAVVATVFAYEGWILATSINAELKNSKRNLPKALVLGTIIIVIIYLAYYIGVAGGASIDVLRQSNGPLYSFLQIFGSGFGTVLHLFIVISCLGTLNGLMMGSVRGMYALGMRGVGPKSHITSEVDAKTNVPHNSAVLGLVACVLWMVLFYAMNLSMKGSGSSIIQVSWFGNISFDSSELPIVSIYAMYIPIIIMMMVKCKGLSKWKRFVVPVLAILSCMFMVFAAIYSHGEKVLYFLVFFSIIMSIGGLMPWWKIEDPRELSLE